MKKVFLLGMLLLAFTTFQCKKGTTKAIRNNEIAEASRKQNPDSLSLLQSAIGTWKWTKRSCYWDGNTTKADKDISLQLDDNGNYSIHEGKAESASGTWQIQFYQSGSYKLITNPSNEYLTGLMYVCDKQLLVCNSYIDGCDHLFEK